MTIACFDGDLISVVNRDDSKVAIEFNALLVEKVINTEGTPEDRQSKGELTGLVNLAPETAVELGKILLQKGQIHLVTAQAQAEAAQESDDAPIEGEVVDEEEARPTAWADKYGEFWHGERDGVLRLAGTDPDEGVSHAWGTVDTYFGPLTPVTDTP